MCGYVCVDSVGKVHLCMSMCMYVSHVLLLGTVCLHSARFQSEGSGYKQAVVVLRISAAVYNRGSTLCNIMA